MRGLTTRARGVSSTIAGLALFGCGSTGQVAPADGVGLLSVAPPGMTHPLSIPASTFSVASPPAARPAQPTPSNDIDVFAPRVTPFRPAAGDLLHDLATWDAATSAQRRARAESLAARLPGFALKEMKTFECGTQRHEVAIFVREPIRSGDDMELVLLPCGPPAKLGTPIREGNDAPEERIAADAPFLIARTEVSSSDWIRSFHREIEQVDPAPVGGVSYKKAVEFCVRAGLDLPSSAQWEFACRAGATTRFFFGDDAARLPEFAWTAANSGGHVHPPAEKLPNAFGLFDVYGNLREWCRDGQARHVCPRVHGQGFDGGVEASEGNGRAHWARKSANLGFRPVFNIPDEKAWDDWPHHEIRRVIANGDQTYRFESRPDGKPEWTSGDVQADLVDEDGRIVGSHCGDDLSSLIWEIGGEWVDASPLRERCSRNAGAVSEVQFIVKPVGAFGAFAYVSLIERLRTTGGAAPAVGDDRKIGDEVSVPFTADFVFRDTSRR